MIKVEDDEMDLKWACVSVRSGAGGRTIGHLPIHDSRGRLPKPSPRIELSTGDLTHLKSNN